MPTTGLAGRARRRTVPAAAAAGLAAFFLSGCGPDTLGAAATTATIEAKAAKQAQEQKAQMETRIREMQEADQKRVQGIDDKVEGVSR